MHSSHATEDHFRFFTDEPLVPSGFIYGDNGCWGAIEMLPGE
jgi:hypothetical protein